MNGSRFPTAKALALAVGLAVAHFVLAHVLLFAGVAGGGPPFVLGYQILMLPLLAVVPDVFGRPDHYLVSFVYSLACRFVAAWALCFARWSRRTKGTSLRDARLGTACVALAAIVLVLGEIRQPGDGPEAARVGATAARRAEVAEADAARYRADAEAHDRAAADPSVLPHIREFRGEYGREARAQADEAERRARSYRSEAASDARRAVRPGTRHPALVLLAAGLTLGVVARRRKRRTDIEFIDAPGVTGREVGHDRPASEARA